MEVTLYSPTGETNKTVAMNEAVFGCDFNEGLVHQVVVAIQAGWRSGNSAQKTRSEVRGGGIKPWRQKGTGRARAGSIRSPLWRKGGVIFAAKPRDYSQKVNKKVYKKAFCGILSELNRQGRLLICEQLTCEQPKTKAFKEQMLAITKTENVLIVLKDVTFDLYLSARNLPHVEVIDVIGLDPVSLLAHEKVLMTQDALEMLNGYWGEQNDNVI